MKKILKHIWKHVVKWNEYITIPIAILLWYFSPVFLHWIDPTAATYDSGIFQIILLKNNIFFLLLFIVLLYHKDYGIPMTFP